MGRLVVIEVVDGEDCSGVVVEVGGCSSIEGETPSLLPRRACTERSRLACCSFESLPVNRLRHESTPASVVLAFGRTLCTLRAHFFTQKLAGGDLESSEVARAARFAWRK